MRNVAGAACSTHSGRWIRSQNHASNSTKERELCGMCGALSVPTHLDVLHTPRVTMQLDVREAYASALLVPRITVPRPVQVQIQSCRACTCMDLRIIYTPGPCRTSFGPSAAESIGWLLIQIPLARACPSVRAATPMCSAVVFTGDRAAHQMRAHLYEIKNQTHDDIMH
jgi:hypothetical protein